MSGSSKDDPRAGSVPPIGLETYGQSQGLVAMDIPDTVRNERSKVQGPSTKSSQEQRKQGQTQDLRQGYNMKGHICLLCRAEVHTGDRSETEIETDSPVALLQLELK